MTQRRRKLYQFLVAGFAGAGCFVLGAVAVVTWSYFAGADKSVAATSIKLETAAGSQVAVKQRYRPALNPTIVRQPAADKVRKPSYQELPRQTPSRSATRADGQTKLQSPKLASLTEGKDVSSKVRPPMIALVIDDVGLNLERSRAAINLPVPATMAILPYGRAAKSVARLAQARGHDVILHLPMQPHRDSADPGPNALRVDLKPAELRRRLHWNLSQIEGFVGVNNHMGSRYTEQEGPMRLVFQELAKRRLFFLDSRTTPKTATEKLAAEMALPLLSRDIFIDDSLAKRDIDRQLARAVRVVKQQGNAILIGHPHQETLAALRPWIARQQAKGVRFVTLRQILGRRGDLRGQQEAWKY